MKKLLETFFTNPAVQQLNAGKTLSFSSTIEEALVIASSFRLNPRELVIVKNNEYNAQQLFQELSPLLESECALFSVEESLRVQAINESIEGVASRVEVLGQLLQHQPRVIVTHATALTRCLPDPAIFKAHCLNLEVGQEVHLPTLREQLSQAGYQLVSHIDHPLTYAYRGGILDIYPMNLNNPVRIEFFGDEIDSIRYFDIATQRSVESISNTTVIPATDLLMSEEERRYILEKLDEIQDEELKENLQLQREHLEMGIYESHLYPFLSLLENNYHLLSYCNHPEVILSPHDAITEHLHHSIEENITYIQEMIQEKKMMKRFGLTLDFETVIRPYPQIEVEPFGRNISQIEEVLLPKLPLEQLLPSLIEENPRLRFCLSESAMKQVMEACHTLNIVYTVCDSEEEIEEGVQICFDSGLSGFKANAENICLISTKELFESRKKLARYANKFKNAEVLHSYQDLKPGDYVVHNKHGVGQFSGLETKLVQGLKKDFLKIIYRGNDLLYVPLEQFQLVRKFVSREGVIPKLNKLGTQEWANTKARLKANVDNIAERLVNLYSLREENIGYQYHEDTELQKEFEKEFEYDLTPDQEKAIAEVKQDMMSTKPMDRLICGDVGFGKTEVALRATFKAVMEGKQVALLCPTTILSSQHYRTFNQRFRNYPITVRLLNRFVSAHDQKAVIQEIKQGTADVVIGTHRLLSSDLHFRDLGLLVIDEEQRFGVEHKEKIKELKESVDVLSLSATPIPRTLQMSLIGVRQCSQLETPPNNRMPVQTYIVEKNMSLIQEVIERELARKGQVFYLYNKIDDIYNVARKIQKAIKGVRVSVAHGQMTREEIEEVMMEFIQGESDVLVCTTIIETGIDIPNANTILIENADRFGLAQLYQIKGRVGRSDRIAYAYLMVPRKKQLSEIATKRLQAIKDFANLGSGYKVAMRDLTIRGAGDLLGPEQSGFIDTVGIDMYIEMLNEAIKTKQGLITEVKEEIVPKANIPVESYIPNSFTHDDFDKITLYQKIDAIKNREQLQELKEAVQDEYGKLPSEVQALFDKRRLDLLMGQEFVADYRTSPTKTTIVYNQEFSDSLDGLKFFEFVNRVSKDIQIRYTQKKINVEIPRNKNELAQAIQILENSKGMKKDES